MSEILKGLAVAEALSEKLKQQIEDLAQQGIKPALTIVRAGSRTDDLAYENGVKKRFEKLGLSISVCEMPVDATTQDICSKIETLNNDDTVHGVLIMRPLPKQIDDAAVRKALSIKKDVDGITDGSMAGVYSGSSEAFMPCTARACEAILDFYKIDISGKRVVVVGRSLVIGRPVAMLLMSRNATVTVCHTKTQALDQICQTADILVVAAGQVGIVTKNHLRAGQTVIDVGIHVNESGTVCGDVLFDEASQIVDAITPVPGGVGSVTTTILAQNVVLAAQNR